jgi:hypothetical protein
VTLAHSLGSNGQKFVTTFNDKTKSMTDEQFTQHIHKMKDNDLLAISWHKKHKAKVRKPDKPKVTGGETNKVFSGDQE